MASPKVLLVGWDAADWKVIRPLITAGKMPNVERLIRTGVHGSVATLHPPLSPMLWTSIATGKRPFKHGILGFSEPTPDMRGVQPVSSLSRKSKAIWNILHQNALRSVVVGWWPSHPVEPIRGVMLSDHFHRASEPLENGWPMRANAVHPPELAATISGLRVHPDQITPEMVEPFIPQASEINQETDKRLGGFLRTLAECMSIHSAAAWLIDHEPWDFFAVYFDSIDHVSHLFMRYHPPRQSWINERDFELYQNVLSMAYQLQDEMLGTLLDKAGDEVTVVLLSDHGFHPDHLRPASIPDVPAGPAVEHRDFGILAISGPSIRKGQPLRGASVLDIAPTVLSLCGLPVAEDMDGKVLTRAFTGSPKISFISSWEEVDGDDGTHPPHARFDPIGACEAMEQMIALGYIERPDRRGEVAVEKTLRELRYNLAEAYQDAGRHVEAKEILTALCEAAPHEERFALRRFASCQALGLGDEMRRMIEDLETSGRNIAPAVVEFLRAQLCIAENRCGQAVELLKRLPQSRPVLTQIAGLYEHLGRWKEARDGYDRALETDPDEVRAYLGLCRIALRRRNFSAAAGFALDAVERTDQIPLAHYYLGCALEGLGQHARAAEAYCAAISFNPNYPEAHARLARLYEKHFGDHNAAAAHRALAAGMRRRTTEPLLIDEQALSLYPTAPVIPASGREKPRLSESLIVVTGLPRSGTSMIMRMLASGGIDLVSDGLREADEDNPHGYFETERVKTLPIDSGWLYGVRGKAIKIVAPLLNSLPADLPCRVILCLRDLNEVLDSQERMLRHRGEPLRPWRRRILKNEYHHTLARIKATLRERPNSEMFVIDHHTAICHPSDVAQRVNEFLEGGLDVVKMAAAIDPALYRNRTQHAAQEGSREAIS